MATYIVLSKYTAKGAAAITESANRGEDARNSAKKLGAELRAWYSVMGRYDVVTIWEAPNVETMAKVLLSVAALGNVTTETLQAFTEDQFRGFVSTLG